MTTESLAFAPLPGVYEPSAIVQLADGGFLVVEDEKDHPFTRVDIAADGRVSSRAIRPGWFADDRFWKLDDLEGLASDPDGWLYAVTSHSRTGAGEEKKARDKLVRFRLDGDRPESTRVGLGLKAALGAAHPALDAAAGVLDVKGAGGLNIEGLEYHPGRRCLLVGLRGPLIEGRAVVAEIANLAAWLEAGEAPRVVTPVTLLDLAGDGIRGLGYVPELAGFLIISGPLGRAPTPFRLWFWGGAPGDPARPVTAPGLASFGHSEGICPARLDGRAGLLLVSDDGERAAGRPASYLWLALATLHA